MTTTAEERQSNQFRDATGRTWALSLNIGLARKIRDQAGVDFGNLRTLGQSFIDLSSDVEKLAAVLWLFLEPAADSLGVTRSDIEASFDGDAIDAALEAMLDAVISFTRASEREAVRAAMTQLQAGRMKSMDAVARAIEREGGRTAARAVAAAELALSGQSSPD